MGQGRGSAAAIIAVIAALALTGCNDIFPGAWGANLGNGTLSTSSVPVEVDTSGALADVLVAGVAASENTSCAVQVDGTAACWGGYKEISAVPLAWPMDGVLTGRHMADAQAALFSTSALTTDGRVVVRYSSTQQVVLNGVLADQTAVQLSHTAGHGCVLTADGRAACFGNNFGGMIGDGTTDNQRFEPVWVVTTGALNGKNLTQIQTGAVHTCALADDSTVACWGINAQGQLGDGTTIDSLVPIATNTGGVLAGKTITGLSVGTARHMCAVTEDGGAACWGQNGSGQLGDGTVVNSSDPVNVRMVGALAGRKIVAMAVSGGALDAVGSTCALLDNQAMACWGDNSSGQLGNGTTIDSLNPVAVSPLASGARPATEVVGGGLGNLALYQDVPGTEFVSIAPDRVIDTRGGVGPLGSGDVVEVDLSATVPVGTQAVAFNVTATGQTASGYAVVGPGGVVDLAGRTSTLNWSAPLQTIANGFFTRISADRKLRLAVTSTGTTELVVDVRGFFVPPGYPEASLYMPADERIYDSRAGDGPLLPGENRVLNIGGTSPMSAGTNGVAPTADAVNVTVTGTVGSGVLSVAELASPDTSTINWTGAAQTVAKAVVTDVGLDGSFTVTNNGGTRAEVVVDLTGTFVPAGAGYGARYFPIDPARLYDSRTTNGPLIAGQSRVSPFPVPADAVALALNTTVTGTSGTGYLAVTPPESTVPGTSTVNWFASPTTRANGSIVPVTDTTARAYAGGSFATDYLFDTAGYFKR